VPCEAPGCPFRSDPPRAPQPEQPLRWSVAGWDGSEGARTQLSLMVRPKPMSPNGEQAAHNVVDREEPLGLCRRFEAAHVALASARRLV
jgi:hypothetical protein